MPEDCVLELVDIHVAFPVASDWRGRATRFAHAVNGVDLRIRRGEAFGIVGESGCGKSTLAQLIMGLVPASGGQVRRGTRADGTPINCQIVFQDPQSSLNPRLPAWRVVTEPLVVRRHGQRLPRAELRERARSLATQVGLRPEHMDRTVDAFSGGQRQRVAIARALASDPDVMVLDEPTSALDVSVQAQVLNLLQDLRAARGLTYVLISHNVSVIRHVCERVAVMYLGQVVEQGSVAAVFGDPRHPYTQELLAAVPRLDRPWKAAEQAVPDELPSNRTLPTGCFFRSRCPYAGPGCELPQKLGTRPDTPDHGYRCHRAVKGELPILKS